MAHHGDSVLQAQVAEILAKAKSVSLAKPGAQAALAYFLGGCQFTHGQSLRQAACVVAVNHFEKIALCARSETFVRVSVIGRQNQAEEDSGEDGLQVVRSGFERAVSGDKALQQFSRWPVDCNRRVAERSQRLGIGEFESYE